MKTIVVTGTGTGVGKTIVTAALAALIQDAGYSVAVVKPYQTGVLPGADGDLAMVQRLTGLTDLHEFARFDEPLAPATAARRSGVSAPEAAEVVQRIHGLHDRHFVIVEGAGGALVQFNRFKETLLDVIAELDQTDDTAVLLVAGAGLGTLSAAALTARAVQETTGEPIVGVIVGDWPAEPDLASRCNLADLPRYADAPLVGVVPMGAAKLGRPEFLTMARAAFTLSLGGTFDATDFIKQNAAPLPDQKGQS
jgi:dethiobiotin synthetase